MRRTWVTSCGWCSSPTTASALREDLPASELSEADLEGGAEASGKGNMKFSLKRRPPIGTMDGANIEIREEVGDDNSSSSASSRKR